MNVSVDEYDLKAGGQGSGNGSVSEAFASECEEPGLVLRTHRKRSGVALHTFNPSAGEAVTGAPLGPVVSQCHLMGELLAP